MPLWRAMGDAQGPRACSEPNARHALTHTYKFMPIMTRLVSKPIPNEKKIELLSVMQDISYGIKISWQEPYLTSLMKQLTEWIAQPFTVDTYKFVLHLISLKDCGYGGVDVCRLLLCLSAATRGAAQCGRPTLIITSCEVLSNIGLPHVAAHKSFAKSPHGAHALVDRDATQLLHAYMFVKDLCDDSNLRGMVAAHPNFTCGLQDALKNLMELSDAPDDAMEPEQVAACIQNSFKFLTVFISLDIYAFRGYHDAMLRLCLSTRIPETLELFAAVVLQYKGEGQLPHELIPIIADSLPRLLLPPAVEPEKGGLQWVYEYVCLGVRSRHESKDMTLTAHICAAGLQDENFMLNRADAAKSILQRLSC